MVELLRPRIKKLDQFAPDARLFLADEVAYDPAAVQKFLTPDGIAAHLDALREAYAALDPFEPPALEATLRQVAELRSVKAAALIHATRVAVTGRSVSPGLFDVLALLGRDRSVERMSAAARLVAS